MTTYVTADAVIYAPGVYEYREIGPEQAKRFLTQSPWVTRLDDPDAQRHILTLVAPGTEVPTSKDPLIMALGDEALVVRRKIASQPHGAVQQGDKPPVLQPAWGYWILRCRHET
jgi:hypothetical protein